MESLLSTVAAIDVRTERMETVLNGMLAAFRTGGVRGLRSFAARPDPDGSRARMLSDGLASLEDHRG